MDRPTYKHQDLRVFNDVFTLALSEVAFTQVMRAAEKGGLAQNSLTDNGFAVELLPTDNIRSFRFNDRYMIMMTEKGVRALRDNLVNSPNPHMQALVGHIDNCLKLTKQWEADREDDFDYDEDPRDRR